MSFLIERFLRPLARGVFPPVIKGIDKYVSLAQLWHQVCVCHNS